MKVKFYNDNSALLTMIPSEAAVMLKEIKRQLSSEEPYVEVNLKNYKIRLCE
jgi:hypothetical protein